MRGGGDRRPQGDLTCARLNNLHSAVSSWSPRSSSAAPLAACSARRLSASWQRLKDEDEVKTGEERGERREERGERTLSGPQFSPIVPAFLWCALLPPSLQALLMLLVAAELVPSSPPDRDSKLDCMNLSRLPTWSTLSMLRKENNDQ